MWPWDAWYQKTTRVNKKIKIHPAPILDSAFILQKATCRRISKIHFCCIFPSVNIHGFVSRLLYGLKPSDTWSLILRVKYIYIHTSKYRGSEKPVSERKRERGRESDRETSRGRAQVFLVILEGNHKQILLHSNVTTF